MVLRTSSKPVPPPTVSAQAKVKPALSTLRERLAAVEGRVGELQKIWKNARTPAQAAELDSLQREARALLSQLPGSTPPVRQPSAPAVAGPAAPAADPEALAASQRLLAELRAGGPLTYTSAQVSGLLAEAKAGKVNLERLGTSEAELRQLVTKGHRQQLEFATVASNSGQPVPRLEGWRERLTADVAAGLTSWKELGVTEASLQKFRGGELDDFDRLQTAAIQMFDAYPYGLVSSSAFAKLQEQSPAERAALAEKLGVSSNRIAERIKEVKAGSPPEGPNALR